MNDHPGTRLPAEIGLVLIAHGSRREEANQDLHLVVANLRRLGYARTFASFLELASPSIVEAGNTCVASGARQVVLAPYFLSAGRHVTEDLQAARDELAAMHPGVDFRCAGPLGPHPLLEQILLQRVAECVAEPASGQELPR